MNPAARAHHAMRTVSPKSLKKVGEPGYGTLLYRDRNEPDLHYLSVLCGGVGQYERVFLITRAQFEEHGLDDPARQYDLANGLAKGRTGFEEVLIQRDRPRRTPPAGRPPAGSAPEAAVIYRMPLPVRIESLLLSGAFAILFVAAWRLLRADDPGSAGQFVIGAMAAAFCVWALDDLYGLLARPATLVLDREGLTIGRRFFFLPDMRIPWDIIAAVPEARMFSLVGRGPPRLLLDIVLADGTRHTLNQVRIDENLNQVRSRILAFLEKRKDDGHGPAAPGPQANG